MVIDNVNDALHAAHMNVGDKSLQIVDCSKFRIDLAVIRDGVRAA